MIVDNHSQMGDLENGSMVWLDEALDEYDPNAKQGVVSLKKFPLEGNA